MPATYTLISSNVLSSGTASVTFSSIPQTYADLVLQISARSARGSTVDDVYMRINGNGAVSYSNTYMNGTGTAVQSSRNNISQYMAVVLSADGDTALANTFGTSEIYIPSYTVAQKHPVSAFGAQENNTTAAFVSATAGLARVPSAITQIDLTPGSGLNWLAGSSFYLYGIKNS